MPLPEPEPGLVISYDYLWWHEYRKGQKEGRKTRPCVIVLAVEEKKDEKIVTVVPITHSPPKKATHAVEIPLKVKEHLKLDDDRSWIILDEVNQFAWPGFDLRPVPGSKTRYDFGFLPPKLFDRVKMKMLDLFLEGHSARTKRN